MSHSAVPRPPKPPEVARGFAPATSQLVGVGALVLLVLAALFDVFGLVHADVSAEGGPLRIETTYPERFRYKTIDALDVEVTNTSDAPLEDVVVRFDRAYLDAFSTVTFTPSLDRVTDEAYEVRLDTLPAGATRPVSVEIQAEAYWRHTGFVEGSVPAVTVRHELATLVFP